MKVYEVWMRENNIVSSTLWSTSALAETANRLMEEAGVEHGETIYPSMPDYLDREDLSDGELIDELWKIDSEHNIKELEEMVQEKKEKRAQEKKGKQEQTRKDIMQKWHEIVKIYRENWGDAAFLDATWIEKKHRALPADEDYYEVSDDFYNRKDSLGEITEGV